MAVSAAQQHIALARDLPPRLLHFFKRFPPPQLQAASRTPPKPAQTSEPTASAAAAAAPEPPAHDSTPSPSDAASTAWKHNPFLAHKNPATGHWHGPHYSLRRQTDLYRLAQAHHVLPLMPVAPKHPDVRERMRIERGLRVKGTGHGQKVKGKYWERTLQSRLEVRRRAMESMPDMINLWKERGHGRGWKRYPKGKGAQAEGEVFRGDMRHAWVHERAAPGA